MFLLRHRIVVQINLGNDTGVRYPLVKSNDTKRLDLQSLKTVRVKS